LLLRENDNNNIYDDVKHNIYCMYQTEKNKENNPFFKKKAV